MTIHKRIEDQEFTEEEKRHLVDWLERVADGRLTVNYPPVCFGLRMGAGCDRAKVRALCEKVKIKPPGIAIKGNDTIIRA